MRKDRIDLTVIVPAYNEKQNMAPLAKSFLDLIRANRFSIEVLVVDDGSRDGTALEVRQLSDRYRFLRVVEHRKNLGKTAAIQTGIRNSCGDAIVIFDADLQFDPFDIPRLYEKLNEGYDIVTGKKIGTYQKPFISNIYNKISRFLFKIPVTDMNSIKIFRRHVMQGIPLRKDWHRYMIVLAVDRGYSVTEIDVSLRPRLYGISKFKGPGRALVGFFDLLAVWFLLAFMKKPMMFFGTMGFFGILSGGVLGAGILVARLVYDWGYPPLQTLVVLLLQLGFTSFIFGALAEMVASLREKVDMLNPAAYEHITKKTRSSSHIEKNKRRPDRSSSKEKVERKRTSEPFKREVAPVVNENKKVYKNREEPSAPKKERPERKSDSRSVIDSKPKHEKKIEKKPLPKVEKKFSDIPEKKSSVEKEKILPKMDDKQSFGRSRRKGQAAAPVEAKEKGFKLSIDENEISFGRGKRKKGDVASEENTADTKAKDIEVQSEKTSEIIKHSPPEPKEKTVVAKPKDKTFEEEFVEKPIEQKHVEDVQEEETKDVSFGRGKRKTFSVPSEPSTDRKKIETGNISFGRGKTRK